MYLDRAHELLKAWGGAVNTAAPTQSLHANRPATSAGLRGEWAAQAKRHINVYHQTRKKVNNLLQSSLARPVGHVTAAPVGGAAPAGFGGSGFTGAPSTNLGAPPTAGSYTPPPAIAPHP